MYDDIINIKTLMQLLYPKSKRGINAIIYYFYLSPVWTIFMYYVNNKIYYLESIAGHIKTSLSIWNKYFCETDGFRWRLKVTIIYIKDPGLPQPEHYKPLKVSSVAARLIG